MKLIKPSVEYIPQPEGIEGVYQHIDKCARVCYKSEQNFKIDMSKEFVDRLIKSGHLAMLEHGTLYLAVPITTNHSGFGAYRYEENPYSQVVTTNGLALKDEFNDPCDCWLITTNYRVLVENDWLDDLEYLCEPTRYHAKRYTLKFITDIGIVREILRHRKMSFANESTRYCNYSKDTFGKEITFVLPTFMDKMPWELGSSYKAQFVQENFLGALEAAEIAYLGMLEVGASPQQARAMLPLATKSELIVTGFEEDWMHFFDLRLRGTTGKPHPDMQYVAQLAWNEFKDKLNLEL